LDHSRNEDILDELKVDPIEKKVTQYKHILLHHVSRIKENTLNNSLTTDLSKEYNVTVH